MRPIPAERLRPGDWIICREVVESRIRPMERMVERVRVERGVVLYDVCGSATGRHARCVGVRVRLAG